MLRTLSSGLCARVRHTRRSRCWHYDGAKTDLREGRGLLWERWDFYAVIPCWGLLGPQDEVEDHRAGAAPGILAYRWALGDIAGPARERV